MEFGKFKPNRYNIYKTTDRQSKPRLRGKGRRGKKERYKLMRIETLESNSVTKVSYHIAKLCDYGVMLYPENVQKQDRYDPNERFEKDESCIYCGRETIVVQYLFNRQISLSCASCRFIGVYTNHYYKRIDVPLVHRFCWDEERGYFRPDSPNEEDSTGWHDVTLGEWVWNSES